VGGDIAYTKGWHRIFQTREWELGRWQTFLKIWKEASRHLGRLVPFLPVVGNHDVPRRVSPDKEPIMFYEIFAFPQRGAAYRMVDVGNYLSLALLDTGHTHAVEGEQTSWLKESLMDRQRALYKMAAYHVSAYPAYYPWDGGTPIRIRELWSPLFETFGTQVAFEHHNHCYKRTHPMVAGEIDPTGVLYLGDGAWGVTPRHPDAHRPYLAMTAMVNHAFIVTLQPEKAVIGAWSREGEKFDEVVIGPGGVP
jgi:hypothetical protein